MIAKVNTRDIAYQQMVRSLVASFQPDNLRKYEMKKWQMYWQLELVSALFKENIQEYLKACTTLGLRTTDLFNTVDLFENKNMNVVRIFLISLFLSFFSFSFCAILIPLFLFQINKLLKLIIIVIP